MMTELAPLAATFLPRGTKMVQDESGYWRPSLADEEHYAELVCDVDLSEESTPLYVDLRAGKMWR